jgi:hypothetical protein
MTELRSTMGGPLFAGAEDPERRLNVHLNMRFSREQGRRTGWREGKRVHGVAVPW